MGVLRGGVVRGRSHPGGCALGAPTPELVHFASGGRRGGPLARKLTPVSRCLPSSPLCPPPPAAARSWRPRVRLCGARRAGLQAAEAVGLLLLHGSAFCISHTQARFHSQTPTPRPSPTTQSASWSSWCASRTPKSRYGERCGGKPCGEVRAEVQCSKAGGTHSLGMSLLPPRCLLHTFPFPASQALLAKLQAAQGAEQHLQPAGIAAGI